MLGLLDSDHLQTHDMLMLKLTLSRAEPIITVHMLCQKKSCALQENVVSKQLTLNDQKTTDQYCKVLTERVNTPEYHVINLE